MTIGLAASDGVGSCLWGGARRRARGPVSPPANPSATPSFVGGDALAVVVVARGCERRSSASEQAGRMRVAAASITFRRLGASRAAPL